MEAASCFVTVKGYFLHQELTAHLAIIVVLLLLVLQNDTERI